MTLWFTHAFTPPTGSSRNSGGQRRWERTGDFDTFVLKFGVERLVIDKHPASGIVVRKRLYYNATLGLKCHGIFQFTIALLSQFSCNLNVVKPFTTPTYIQNINWKALWLDQKPTKLPPKILSKGFLGVLLGPVLAALGPALWPSSS